MSPITLYGPRGEALKPSRRGFDGARHTRHTSDWIAESGVADKFLGRDAKTLRERSRAMERDEGYAEAFLMELESNIIGPKGIQVKPVPRKADARNKGGLANKIDTDAQNKISQAWEDYSRRGNYEVTRQLSRAMFERLTIRTVARDGGYLKRLVDGFSKNEFRFAVQGLEVDVLDSKKKVTGSQVPIEFDEWGEPVTYYLSKKSLKLDLTPQSDSIAVSAADMLHVFVIKRFGQSQGYSWFAPAMTRLRHLSEYEKSEVIAARWFANKLGFIEREGEARYRGDDLDADGNPIMKTGPAEFTELEPGQKANLIDPAHPNANYPDFRKAILRGACAGIYVNYNTLARDLEGVSYSSIRQGTISERDTWRIIQDWFIGVDTAPTYERWLKMALMAGKIEGYTVADYERLRHAEFAGRTWAWVDPEKDISAIEREIALGINSRQRVARERGINLADTVRENEEDNAAMEKAGLPTTVGKAQAPAPSPAPVAAE